MVPMNAMFTFYSFINLYAMTGELFTVGSWRIAHYTGKKLASAEYTASTPKLTNQ